MLTPTTLQCRSLPLPPARLWQPHILKRDHLLLFLPSLLSPTLKSPLINPPSETQHSPKSRPLYSSLAVDLQQVPPYLKSTAFLDVKHPHLPQDQARPPSSFNPNQNKQLFPRPIDYTDTEFYTMLPSPIGYGMQGREVATPNAKR